MKVLYNGEALTCDVCEEDGEEEDDVMEHNQGIHHGCMMFKFSCGHTLIIYPEEGDRFAFER